MIIKMTDDDVDVDDDYYINIKLFVLSNVSVEFHLFLFFVKYIGTEHWIHGVHGSQ